MSGVREKRTRAASSSHPTKKSKLNSHAVLSASAANANGGRGSSTRPKPVKNPKGKGSSIKTNPKTSDYMTTLLHSAPHAEHNKSETPQNEESQFEEGENIPNTGSSITCLNSAEEDYIRDFHDDGKSDEEVEDGEEGLDGDVDEGIECENEDNLMVEDVTPSFRHYKTRRTRGAANKVLVTDFRNPKFAVFAKRCARMATCIVEMCPQDALFSWPTFKEEMDRLVHEGRGDDFVKALAETNEDPSLRDRLVRFMSYGTSAVRLDIGKEARIRALEFFDIPGKRPQHEIISLVSWLMKDRHYHHGEVDLIKKTTNKLPFQTPLLGRLLRGYLIEGKPKQDKLLISRLQREERIPVPLIIMATVLIGHALQEYSSGYKVENSLSISNLTPHYQSVTSTFSKIEARSPAYVELLQKSLYEQMMTAGPEILPSQTYDYNELTSFALKSGQLSGQSNIGQTEAIKE